MLLAAQPALAQVTPPSLPSQSDISRSRVTLPPPKTPDFDLRIQRPEKAPVARAIDEVDFAVTGIMVDGATAFPPDQVNAFFAPLVGKTVGLEALREAATRLENLYSRKGFFLSRVFVPPQQVKDGVLTVRVIEGYIGDIYVEGMDRGSRARVEAMLAPLLKRKPIDLASVERRLLVLNDLPGLSGTSVLRPGADLGASDLVVTLAKPADLYQVTVNNSASKILGPWSYSALPVINRPFSLPGTLLLGVSAGGRKIEAVRSANLRYSVPIGTSGLIASLGGVIARSRPAGSLRPLEIQSDLTSLSLRSRYPILRGRKHSLFLEAGLAVNRFVTDILGQRIVDDRSTVGDVGLIYQQNGWLAGSTTVALGVAQGLPILGAGDKAAPFPSVLGFDPGFTKLTYTIQRTQRLPRGFSALAALQGQYSSSKLLAGELVSFGGPSIGRGYDPSAIAGDRGIGGLFEVRRDVRVKALGFYTAQPYVFADAARVTTLATVLGPRSSERIHSIGAGFRLFHPHGSIDLQIADAGRRLGSADERRNPRILISTSVGF
ncbi:ShlB/FhaC/HecB family hemolysin secretion/activation protein [Sphingomonas humi]|uniref:POTRA domain-containing protein n=1 Tax=Sphingomonas humi TaxID=335630 RepID=A0ABP7SES9_9SPHN